MAGAGGDGEVVQLVLNVCFQHMMRSGIFSVRIVMC